MRVLMTNQDLHVRGGSQLYLRDLARGLVAQGWQPIAYAPRLGPAADELRAEGVPVVDDLSRVSDPPDVIHGQHQVQTMAALLHFPRVPAVFVCHGWLPWVEAPPRFPRILRYVAVDGLRRERLVSESGISPSKVEVLPNFVDLSRIRRRIRPLPSRPAKALLFSNQAGPASLVGDLVGEACREEGVVLEHLGFASHRSTSRPGDLLADYDVVFARGRSAMEAMAAGVRVVLCDAEGLGPLVTRDNVEELWSQNFGLAALREPVEVGRLRDRLRRAGPDGAEAVTAWVRHRCPMEPVVDRWLAIYRGVVEDHGRSTPFGVEAADAESRAASQYLGVLERRSEEMRRDVEGLRAHLAQLERGVEQQADAWRRQVAEVEASHRALEEERDRIRTDLLFLQSTAAFRLRHWLSSGPVGGGRLLGRLYRWTARLVRGG